MGYSIDQDLEIMKEIERISQEPVNESQYTAVRHGGKPIVESMAVFDDVKVDFNKWTSDNKKVNKAKTVDTGSAKPITKNDTVEEKKEDGKVTEVKNVEMTKKKDQVVEAKQESDGDKAKPAPEVKNFDSKAKSAAASNRAGADKEKHFAEVAKKQKKFKAFIESLVVDEASRQAADTVLAEAEKVFKAQFEAIDAGDDSSVATGLGKLCCYFVDNVDKTPVIQVYKTNVPLSALGAYRDKLLRMAERSPDASSPQIGEIKKYSMATSGKDEITDKLYQAVKPVSFSEDENGNVYGFEMINHGLHETYFWMPNRISDSAQG